MKANMQAKLHKVLLLLKREYYEEIKIMEYHKLKTQSTEIIATELNIIKTTKNNPIHNDQYICK